MSNETPARQLSISVVMPVYNAATYLKEAIDSVTEQTRFVKEIIVMDDRSTDDSLAVARSFGGRVRCFSQSHRGIGATRNAGVREATGDLLAFLDADDRLELQAMETLGQILEQNPETDIVFGQLVEFFSSDLSPEQRARFEVKNGPQSGSTPGTMLIRRAAFLKTGFFREDLEVAEFVDWHIRAQEAGLRILNVPIVTLNRRIHLTNMSHFNATRAKDYLTVIRNRLHRQRTGHVASR